MTTTTTDNVRAFRPAGGFRPRGGGGAARLTGQRTPRTPRTPRIPRTPLGGTGTGTGTVITTIRLPAGLHAALVGLAEAGGASLNTTMLMLLAGGAGYQEEGD